VRQKGERLQEQNELFQLRQFSAEIGGNAMLVQAGGGNTSLKVGGGLWIKASGTRLADALREDIFVFVTDAKLNEWIQAGRDVGLEVETEHGTVRASVETAMHAAMPHRAVAHLHSVNAISWAVQVGVQSELSRRLSGIRWVWVPYVHPGIRLSEEIGNAFARTPADVVLLANHGIVLGAGSFEALRTLITEVEERLQLPPTGRPEERLPQSISLPDSWQLAPPEVQALAGSSRYLDLASGGTLYPDHCVYLGPSLPVADALSAFSHAAARYEHRYGIAATAIAIRNGPVGVRVEAKQAALEMLLCLKRVVERIPAGAQITYLTEEAVAKLMSWEAEHYRRNVESLAGTAQNKDLE
jgi:rhamnose utilization protein RhaD (predicted bifunctional aldolase and dehydrogenase)